MKFQIGLLSTLLLVSCVTTEATLDQKKTVNVPVAKQPFVIGAGVTQPEAVDINNHANLAIAPAGTLRISKVTRPRAEMREGPGVNFALSDRILEEGDRVIVFEVHGVWAKVLSVGRWESGWVHSHTISVPKLNKREMTVNFSRFPTVLAVRQVDHGLAFANSDAVKLDFPIPKGKLFKALQVADDKTLIWMAENNAIIWIKGKDMQ